MTMTSVQASQDEDGFSLKDTTLCVVGAGLMGGSLALALRGKVSSIGVVDKSQAVCEQVTDRGIADWADDDLGLAARAQVVVLATPVKTLVRQIGELGQILTSGTVVIDLGSVKGPVVAAMNGLPETVEAVGGHPMCGKEVNGVAYADSHLFHNARFALCRTERTTPKAWQVAYELARAVGAEPLEIDPAQHDKAVAAISHMPYVLASALALAAGQRAQTDPDVWRLAATGFQDASRLAGSDPGMMADVLLENTSAVLDAIEEAEQALHQLKTLLQNGDASQLHGILSAAQSYRKEWERSKKTE
jgi:prephenate dehydrogenase